MLRSRFICPDHSAIGPKSLIGVQSAVRMTKTAFYLGNVGLGVHASYLVALIAFF
jgi:hypothetical protein